MTAAENILMRLLKRAETARLRADDRPASMAMSSPRDAAEYRALRTLAEVEAFHGRIALAERTGAIAVKRACHRGDGQDIERITVVDLAALAAHLGMQLYETRVSEAETRLAPWKTRFPVLDAVLATWRSGGKVRGHGPEAAAALGDAARAVSACHDEARRERMLRRESARLFGDSKRLETLTPWLDLVDSGQLQAVGSVEEAHVWAALGLHKAPPPLLLAGRGLLHLEHGELPLIRPWLGVPPESLRAVQTSARSLLSIENLSSFHDAARLLDDDTLLLYTGGMPSPAWRRAYGGILRSLPADTCIYHWGDIDQGGFRIASVLAHSTAEAGRHLRPWHMSPACVPAAIHTHANSAEPAALKAMCYWAERAGWLHIVRDLKQQPLTLEQELLEATLPGHNQSTSSSS